MAVDDKARKDYEQGQKDAQKGVFEQALNDIPAIHPGTSAYYKGRSGVPLDDDKKTEKKGK